MITNFQILSTVTKTVKPSQYSNRSDYISDYISDLYKKTLSFIQDSLVDNTDSLFTLAKNNGITLEDLIDLKEDDPLATDSELVASALTNKVFDSEEYINHIKTLFPIIKNYAFTVNIKATSIENAQTLADCLQVVDDDEWEDIPASTTFTVTPVERRTI